MLEKLNKCLLRHFNIISLHFVILSIFLIENLNIERLITVKQKNQARILDFFKLIFEISEHET